MIWVISGPWTEQNTEDIKQMILLFCFSFFHMKLNVSDASEVLNSLWFQILNTSGDFLEHVLDDSVLHMVPRWKVLPHVCSG